MAQCGAKFLLLLRSGRPAACRSLPTPCTGWQPGRRKPKHCSQGKPPEQRESAPRNKCSPRPPLYPNSRTQLRWTRWRDFSWSWEFGSGGSLRRSRHYSSGYCFVLVLFFLGGWARTPTLPGRKTMMKQQDVRFESLDGVSIQQGWRRSWTYPDPPTLTVPCRVMGNSQHYTRPWANSGHTCCSITLTPKFLLHNMNAYHTVRRTPGEARVYLFKRCSDMLTIAF